MSNPVLDQIKAAERKTSRSMGMISKIYDEDANSDVFVSYVMQRIILDGSKILVCSHARNPISCVFILDADLILCTKCLPKFLMAGLIPKHSGFCDFCGVEIGLNDSVKERVISYGAIIAHGISCKDCEKYPQGLGLNK